MIDQPFARIIDNLEGIVADLREARRDQDNQELAIRLRYIVGFLGMSMVPAMLNFAEQLAPMQGAESEAKDGHRR